MSDLGDFIIIKLLIPLIPAVVLLIVSALYSWILFKRYRQALKRLYQMNFNSLEMERKRIANDLHDVMGSKVIQLNKTLHMIAETADPQTKESLDHLQDQITELYNETRHTIEFLYPKSLVHGDWQRSIRDLATEMSSQNFIVTLEFYTRISPPESICLHLYRLIQEKLNNIIKYVDTTQVHIDISYDKPKYSVHIIYKGKKSPSGWLTQWVNHSKGRGLHIIKDRLTIMNAVNSITEEDGNIIDEIHFAYENPSP